MVGGQGRRASRVTDHERSRCTLVGTERGMGACGIPWMVGGEVRRRTLCPGVDASVSCQAAVLIASRIDASRVRLASRIDASQTRAVSTAGADGSASTRESHSPERNSCSPLASFTQTSEVAKLTLHAWQNGQESRSITTDHSLSFSGARLAAFSPPFLPAPPRGQARPLTG